VQGAGTRAVSPDQQQQPMSNRAAAADAAAAAAAAAAAVHCTAQLGNCNQPVSGRLCQCVRLSRSQQQSPPPPQQRSRLGSIPPPPCIYGRPAWRRRSAVAVDSDRCRCFWSKVSFETTSASRQ